MDEDWPGSPDGSCPVCGIIRDGWDMEYYVARIDRWGVTLIPEKLISITCPSCHTKFKTADMESDVSSAPKED